MVNLAMDRQLDVLFLAPNAALEPGNLLLMSDGGRRDGVTAAWGFVSWQRAAAKAQLLAATA
eukprot:3166548-Lingulodinium_polyedra.AAC.1